MVQGEPLFDDGHEDVDAHSDPDLGLDSVLGGAVEGLDAKVLLDPFEEQFDLPAGLVQFCDGERRQEEVVGEEDEAFARLCVAVDDAAQGIGIVFFWDLYA